jgi:hypothetical protein
MAYKNAPDRLSTEEDIAELDKEDVLRAAKMYRDRLFTANDLRPLMKDATMPDEEIEKVLLNNWYYTSSDIVESDGVKVEKRKCFIYSTPEVKELLEL